MPATQPTDTRQRRNTDKTAEVLHFLVKLSLLGQKMVEVGASQAPQSESSPESKLLSKYHQLIWKGWTMGSTVLPRLPFLPEKIVSSTSKRDLT